MPLKARDAQTVIRRVLTEGTFISPGPSTHARREMEKDNLTNLDAENVLRCGIVEEAEWEGGSWRYRVRTMHMVFVVALEPDMNAPPGPGEDFDVELYLVTAWRNR